eukprot:TRINITY_DN289_c0_g1_i1.p2 TRINITY_DN289_c0_g1~~TRINITY_DN289_c0_g1_i1.p2  ORF type:complete len:269 (+),score=52.27 TRINITY_DN289_c0_g1_i1:44-808(+)
MEGVGSSLFSAEHVGDNTTADYRVFFQSSGKRVSPFHDIPLVVDKEKGIFNAVIEIPKLTTAKLEISKTESLNPIIQDVKAGKLRHVTYSNTHGTGYMWNYGAFPQTWEDPTYTHPDTNALGDKDPLDVCEIGSGVAAIGEVKQVKVLGVLALIDEGETDWKIIAIDVNDPLASQLNDIGDVEKVKPGYLNDTFVWFRDYKAPTVNQFAFEGQFKDRAYALKLIDENHEFWQKLISGHTPCKGDKYEICITRGN